MLLEKQENISFWAWRVALEFKERVASRVENLGLTAPEAFTLTALFFENGLPLAELAKRLHHSHTAVLRHVDNLEERGLVKRVPHPSDRRIKLLQPTEKSLGMMDQLKRAMEEVHAEAVQGIDPKELARASETLRQVIQNLGGDIEATLAMASQCSRDL